MTGAPVVRLLSANELPRLAELFVYTDFDGMLAEVRRETARGALDVFVVTEAARLLGELRVKYESEDPREAVRGRRAYLFAFRVLPSMQGKGLGKLLLARTLARLAEAGYTEFTIGVEDDNPRARHIYEAFGFTRVIARKSESYQGCSYAYDLLLKA